MCCNLFSDSNFRVTFIIVSFVYEHYYCEVGFEKGKELINDRMKEERSKSFEMGLIQKGKKEFKKAVKVKT